MDPTIDMNAGLTSVAAARLIELLLSTDGWSAVKNAVRSLWRHSHPERVEAELAEARGELLKAEESGGGAELHELLVAEWQARLARLIATRPDIARELPALLLDRPHDATSGATSSTTLTAHVSDGGDAYLAGRDMKITKGGQA